MPRRITGALKLMFGMLVGAWKGGRPLGRLAWGTLACWKPGGGAIPGAGDMPGGGPREKDHVSIWQAVFAMLGDGRGKSCIPNPGGAAMPGAAPG